MAYSTTLEFRKLLKAFRKIYGYKRGEDLSVAIGMGPAYCYQLESKNNPIQTIDDETLNKIAGKFAEKFAENSKTKDTAQLKKDILSDFYKSLRPVKSYQDILYQMTLISKNLTITDSVKSIISLLLNKHNYDPNDFIQNVVNKQGPITIVYSESIIEKRNIKFEENDLEDILSKNKKANYNELYTILYCLYNIEYGSAKAQKETRKTLILDMFPSQDVSNQSEHSDNPHLRYDKINQSLQELDTYIEEEEKRLDFLKKIRVELNANIAAIEKFLID